MVKMSILPKLMCRFTVESEQNSNRLFGQLEKLIVNLYGMKSLEELNHILKGQS